MNVHRVLDRVIAIAATLACFAFVVGLYDVALSRPVTAPFAPSPPVPESERDAELAVRLIAGGDDGRAVDGPPVAGAAVRVFWEQGDRYYLAAAARTDARGAASIQKLPRGRVWVIAEAPGHARASTQLVLDAAPREVRMALADAWQLEVTVLDGAGAPLPGATVLVTTGDPLPFGALTRGDGVASFDRVGPAPWIVKASAPGFESVTRSGVRGAVSMTLRRLGSLEVRVEDAGGVALSGATVSIAGSQLWPARRAETDATGVARIVGLLGGAYDLRAHRGELVSETLMGVTLQRGAHESVTLRLVQGRMVTAVVTDGEADDAAVVPDADVVLVEGGLSSFPLHGRTRTDGVVVLGPIAPGPATLAARAAEFVPSPAIPVPDPLQGPLRIALLRGATLEGEVVDARGFPVDGASVEVIGTDRYGLPIAETPASLSFRRTHFSWALPGPVPLIPMGELGVMPGPVPPIPPPGASLAAVGRTVVASRSAAGLAPQPFDPWVTRADGRFRAYPVTPGRVRALVRHPGYVAGLSEAVRLPSGGVALVRLVLLVGGALEGRLLDDRGFPVAAARVDVASVSGAFERTTLTASDGTFAFAAVPAEIWVSVARPEDLSRIVMRERAQVKDDDRTTIELTLPPAREPARVVIVDADEQPVDGAQVAVLSVDPQSPLRQTQFTAMDGSVTVEGARGLALRVVVDAPGFTRAVRATEQMPEQFGITLQRGVVVTGTVTAVRGRRFVSGATVTVASEGVRRASLTDEQGAYRIRDVPPGPIRLLVSHPGYATRELDVEVEPPGRHARDQQLEPVDLDEPGGVEGEVIDARGEPVAGARVAVGVAPAYLPMGAAPPGTAVTDAHGRFRLLGLSPGAVELEAYAPDVGRGTARVSVDAGRPTSGVAIRLDQSAGEGEPVATGSVAVTLGESGSEVIEVVVVHVAELSEAELAGLEVGDVLLTVDGVEPEDMVDARARLSGPVGSDVVVQVQRDEEAVSLRIARERVRR